VSADFYFGVLIGALVLAIGLVLLLGTMGRRTRTEVEQVLIDLARERNRIAEDHMRVVQGLTGWVGELVELMKDAKISPSSAGLAAESAAVGSEYVLLGGCAGDGEPLSKTKMQEVLDALSRRYGQQAPTVPMGSQPGALFSAVMGLEAEREEKP
jgi:hypothetical protein